MATLTTSWQLIAQTYLGKSGGSLYIRLYARYTEQDVTNNRTYVEYNSRVYYENGNYIQDNQGNGYVEGTGAGRVSFNAPKPTRDETYSTTTGGWVNHNNDGTGNASGKAYLSFPNWGWSASAEGSFSLPTIPRASTPSVSGTLQLGSTITINTNRASSNFEHDIYYSWGTLSNKLISSSVSNSTTWTIPKDLANYIPNGGSGTLFIICETYKGVLVIGTKTISVTVTVPDTEEFRPKITDITLWENSESGVPQSWGEYIQNKSKLSYDVVATGAYSSTISYYNVVVNGLSYNAKSYTTDVLLTKGINSIVATITDSRGRTATYSKTFEVLEYNGPTITNFTANRCLDDGSLDDEGEFVKIEINAIVPKLNNKNSYSYFLKYKDHEETEYIIHEIEVDESSDDKNFILSKTVVMAADGDFAFDYMFMLADTFIGINKLTDVDTVFQLINYHESGTGIAFGKVATRKYALEFNLPMYDQFDQLIPNGLAEYQTGGVDIDPNTTLSHLILTETNTPNKNGFYYVMTLFYAGKDINNSKTQIAFPYIYDIGQNKREVFIRQNVNGTWNDWTQI